MGAVNQDRGGPPRLQYNISDLLCSPERCNRAIVRIFFFFVNFHLSNLDREASPKIWREFNSSISSKILLGIETLCQPRSWRLLAQDDYLNMFVERNFEHWEVNRECLRSVSVLRASNLKSHEMSRNSNRVPSPIFLYIAFNFSSV